MISASCACTGACRLPPYWCPSLGPMPSPATIGYNPIMTEDVTVAITGFLHEKAYLCSRHGEQGPGLRFNIPERGIDKHFCTDCVIAALEEFCQQLTEKPRG